MTKTTTREGEDLPTEGEDLAIFQSPSVDKYLVLEERIEKLEEENRELREEVRELRERDRVREVEVERLTVGLKRAGSEIDKLKTLLREMRSPLPKDGTVLADRLKILEERMAEGTNFYSFHLIPAAFADELGRPLNKQGTVDIKDAFRADKSKYIIVEPFSKNPAVKLTPEYLREVRARLGLPLDEWARGASSDGIVFGPSRSRVIFD